MKKVLWAFSWGHQYPKPGLSNEVMADEVAKIKDQFDFVLVQFEIGQALTAKNITVDHVTKPPVGWPHTYVNSYQVAEDMLAYLKSKGVEASDADISVICHHAHWDGLSLILRKLNLKVKRVDFDIPYDPNSSQWWTRGPLRMLVGKGIHGVQYLFKGEL
ncbi:MAG TPA: hypothetical protein VFK07_02200 [Candidatus Paceibacterota bacterium]|nr:hypothetical protein [Candidatus Paceibacterota bacterium]